MPSRKQYESVAHVLSSVPTSGSILSSVGTTKTAGVMENIGSATTEQFKTIPAFFKAIDTTTSSVTPPQTPVPGLVNDGTEEPATPFMSVTNISIPSSWTPSYTGKSESLSHSITIPNNGASVGTYQIFPNVNIIIESGGTTGAAGVAGSTSTTQAKIEGSATELNTWVSPWNDATTSIPHFDGKDYGQLRSAGYCKESSDQMLLVTFTLTFGLTFSVGGTGSSSTSLDFKIGIINNYDNDRDVYMTAYNNAYQSLAKVPEVFERAS